MKESYKKVARLFIISVLVIALSSWVFTITHIPIAIILAIIAGALITYFMPLLTEILWKAKPYHGKYRDKLLSFAKEHGVMLRQIYVSPSKHSNAHAMGCLNNKCVLYNSITFEKHPADEIMGVMAHEIGHLKNNDAFVTTPIIASIVVLVSLFNFWLHASFTLLVVVSIFETIILLPMVLSINRWREHLADITAKEILSEPASFARFLQRMRQLYELEGIKFPIKLSFIQKLLITHPPFYERIIFLESK